METLTVDKTQQKMLKKKEADGASTPTRAGYYFPNDALVR